MNKKADFAVSEGSLQTEATLWPPQSNIVKWGADHTEGIGTRDHSTDFASVTTEIEPSVDALRDSRPHARIDDDALRHVFFADEGAVEIASASDADVPAVTPERDLRHGLESDGTGLEATKNASKHLGEVIKGFVDGLDARARLTGWACLPLAPTRRVSVNVLSDGSLIASTVADLPRPDVKGDGYGDGCSGFAVPLPQSMLDGRVHQLTVLWDALGAAPFSTDFAVELPALPSVDAAGDGPLVLTSMPPLSIEKQNQSATNYVPGHYVICTMPYPRPAYHVRGWHEPEDDFTWIRGIEGIIEMTIRRPHTAYTFMLEVFPNQFAGRTQTLEVFFNHFRVGFFEVPAPTTLSVELPAELFTRRKAQINLHCRFAEMANCPSAADRRRIGIALRGWCIG
jgi:hypothetical protein